MTINKIHYEGLKVLMGTGDNFKEEQQKLIFWSEKPKK